MTGSSFRGTVSSIEVKSTCSNSPGPLQVRGCMGAIGGAASNLRQWPHFLMRLRRSRAIPGHQNRSCIREVERRWPWCAASRWHRPLPHCGAFEAPQTEDGLLGRPDMGLAIQEAVLKEQLLLGLNIGGCSFLIENRQESFFEGFPGSPKVLHHLIEHRVILLFYLPIYDISGGQFRCSGDNHLPLIDLYAFWTRCGLPVQPTPQEG